MNKQALGYLVTLSILLHIYSCANIGMPTGGEYDETPPKIVSTSPAQKALNVTKKRITLEFDEFIKIEKAAEKVIVSPPQATPPEIKTSGRNVVINLQDSLKKETTYTIDFADAIVDNNEGNPLGSFAFSFSTGSIIDSMEVSGVLLNASNLEPIKGTMIGLHSNLTDSTFQKMPFERVSRSDSRGKFSIKGIAPNKQYAIFALKDANQNYYFDQKSEEIAFLDSLVTPRFELRTRQDTIWLDSIMIDTIMEHQYTHYLPDQLVLRSFKEKNNKQSLIKSEHTDPRKLGFYFATKADSLPILHALNFNQTEAFIIESNRTNDSINYWIKDSLIYQQDTLLLSLTYLKTDSLSQLVSQTDTLKLINKKRPVVKEEKKKKKKKKEERVETPFLQVTYNLPTQFDIFIKPTFLFEEPIASFDSTAIRLEQKVDTLWKPKAFTFVEDSILKRRYLLQTKFEYGKEYRLQLDSMAFVGIYGLHTNKINQIIKVRALDEYSSLFFNITGLDYGFVELLDAQEKVLRTVQLKKGQANFYYLNAGKYYVRAVEDRNKNGVWDTGEYATKTAPENVFYYPKELDIKAKWTLEQDWNVTELPLNQQKPIQITKQKPDEKKKREPRRK